MTKPEFIARRQASKRADTFFRYIMGTMLLVVFTVTALVGDWIQRQPPSIRVWMLFGYLFLAVMFAVGIAFLIGRSSLCPDLRQVACPACGKPLVGITEQIAIASGHCGRCGAEVFDQEPSD